MANPLKARLQALVLADQLYLDARTGKWVVAGIFNTLHASEFPTLFNARTYAFLSLTDIVGPKELVIRYRDMQDFTILMETAPATIQAPPDRLATVNLGIPIPGFPMPHAGAYAFELHMDGEELGSVRMTVQLLK